MATSPIYNWPEPDNTDLVKNGALAIRTLGDAIDTTMATMVPKTIIDAKGDIIAGTAADTAARLAVGTNGQVLKANSATATGLEWGNDTAGMTNPMTTTGDTIYSSSGSTPARLGIGTTGQVLTVAGGLPSWATPSGGGSGLTFISKTDFTASNTVNINSVFTSTYTNYYIVMDSVSTTATQGDLSFRLRASGTDTSANYKSQRLYASGTSVGAGVDVLGTDEIWFSSGSATGNAPQGATFTLMSPNVAKSTTMTGSVSINLNSPNCTMDIVSGFQSSSTQFDGITFNFSQTSTGSIYIYGIAKA